MDTISIDEFFRDAEVVIRKAQQGKRMILTFRGESVLRLEPIVDTPDAEDSFFALKNRADTKAKSLSNKQIDEEIYGA